MKFLLRVTGNCEAAKMDECSLLIPGIVGKSIQGQDKGVGEEERKLARKIKQCQEV